jgi:hypothetical protein
LKFLSPTITYWSAAASLGSFDTVIASGYYVSRTLEDDIDDCKPTHGSSGSTESAAWLRVQVRTLHFRHGAT